jgi:hypothetical protein
LLEELSQILEWRIGTSEARSVLPIWFLCWNYQNRRYYRARVGKTAKGSLARPRAVTDLTGARHRSDRWRPTSTHGPTMKSILSFSPFLLSPPLFTRSHPFQNRETHPSPLSFTSPYPHGDLKFQPRKGSRLEAKGSPKTPLHIPLQALWIHLKFFSPKVFKSSSCPISLHGAKIWISLGRTSPRIT